jgi:hypothetical protein
MVQGVFKVGWYMIFQRKELLQQLLYKSGENVCWYNVMMKGFMNLNGHGGYVLLKINTIGSLQLLFHIRNPRRLGSNAGKMSN